MVSAATNTITRAELAALASALWIMGQEQNEIAVTDSQASISNYSLRGCFEMVYFAPAWDEMGSEEFAHLFLNEVFRRHGLPKQIVSDRGSIFDSAFFCEVCRLLGVKQCMSTAYHPQSDGQTERSNRTLEEMLRHFVSPNQDDWDLRLPCCEFAVNNAWNAATGSTPFFLNQGSHPRSPVSSEVYCVLPGAKSFEERVNEAIAQARNCMLLRG